MNFETGTSGTTSKVLRRRPLTLSMRPASVDVDLAAQAATRSGSSLSEERR